MAERIQRHLNGYLIARVSGGSGTSLHQNREVELLSILDPAAEIRDASDDRRDIGQDGESVSFEESAERIIDLQTALDEQVTQENWGVTYHDRRSLPPCLRVKKDD